MALQENSLWLLVITEGSFLTVACVAQAAKKKEIIIARIERASEVSKPAHATRHHHGWLNSSHRK